MVERPGVQVEAREVVWPGGEVALLRRRDDGGVDIARLHEGAWSVTTVPRWWLRRLTPTASPYVMPSAPTRAEAPAEAPEGDE